MEALDNQDQVLDLEALELMGLMVILAETGSLASTLDILANLRAILLVAPVIHGIRTLVAVFLMLVAQLFLMWRVMD
jgi:hypothetical protein